MESRWGERSALVDCGKSKFIKWGKMQSKYETFDKDSLVKMMTGADNQNASLKKYIHKIKKENSVLRTEVKKCDKKIAAVIEDRDAKLSRAKFEKVQDLEMENSNLHTIISNIRDLIDEA